MATTDIPIRGGGTNGGDGTSVRPVLLLTSVLALVLVLGAGYASVQSASTDLSKRLSAPPADVRGAPMMGGGGDQGGGDGTAGTDGAAGAGFDPSGGAAAGMLPGGYMTHGRADDVSLGSGMPKLPEGTLPIDYATIELPDYEQATNMDGVVRPNEEVFPPEVRELDGKRIALLGFMSPLRLEDETRKALEFVLSPYPPGCHFGTMPGPDEWIDVDATAMGGTPYLAYRVVRVVGTIELGEKYDEYGYLMSLYRIDAERVDELK